MPASTADQKKYRHEKRALETGAVREASYLIRQRLIPMKANRFILILASMKVSSKYAVKLKMI